MSEITEFLRQFDRERALPDEPSPPGPARAGTGRVAELLPAPLWPDASPTGPTLPCFDRRETLIFTAPNQSGEIDSSFPTEPSHTAVTLNPLFCELDTLDDAQFTLID